LAYGLRFHPRVEADLKKLSPADQRRVKRAFDERIAVDPGRFGEPLAGQLRGYLKIRIGDYRIVFRVEAEIAWVAGVFHRRDAYAQAERRLTD